MMVVQGHAASEGSDEVAAPAREGVSVGTDLASGVHEVQNVLTSALGWVQLARASASPEVHARALAVVERALGRASILVTALADPSGRARVDTTVFDPACVLSEVFQLLHPRCSARGVDLSAEPGSMDAAKMYVRGDPGRVAQVVTNLVLNALEAAAAGGTERPDARTVTLGVVTTPTEVGIIVRDHGTGIDPAIRDRIFEPRFTTRPGRGSGLGLPVARSLAEAMGGWLVVTSQPGDGTAVTLWLQRAGDLAIPTEAVFERPAKGLKPGTRVLVVDDEPAIRELLEVALTLRGAVVLAVDSLDAARRTLATQSVDVALVDDALGTGPSGAVFIQELSESLPSVGRVLMTGAPSVEHLADACVHFVRKPFLLDDVVRTLSQALDLRAAP